MPAQQKTIVFLHAHPDDEASGTAGTMARAAADGHRVVVVFGTNGEHGEVPDDLAPGETLADRRRREAEHSARILGVARVCWLGYADSGMTGWAQNGAPNAFCNADIDEAATRLATLLDEEHAGTLVCYDWHGGYGHPDHVQVHRVGHRAAALALHRPRLLESTMNRDAMRRMWQAAFAAAQAGGVAGVTADQVASFDPDGPMDDGNPMGTPEAEIHWQVDVSAFVDRKREALRAHASQVTDVGFFLSMPPEMFAAAFGAEYFVEPGLPAGMRVGWIFDDRQGDGAAVPAATSDGASESEARSSPIVTAAGPDGGVGTATALRDDRDMTTPAGPDRNGARP